MYIVSAIGAGQRAGHLGQVRRTVPIAKIKNLARGTNFAYAIRYFAGKVSENPFGSAYGSVYVHGLVRMVMQTWGHRWLV